MKYQLDFFAFGHPNINPKHKTTLMITKDNLVTTKGDCIVAWQSDLCDSLTHQCTRKDLPDVS